MDALAKIKQPPKPADLEGWRKVIADGRLNEMSLEAIASALQDLGPQADPRVRNALARHLSDSVVRQLRPRVWKTHPNQGKDIIERTIYKIFEALGRPGCPDAVDMRTKFATVVEYRMKDAIAAEARGHRDLDEEKARAKKKQEKARKAQGIKAKEHATSDENVVLEPIVGEIENESDFADGPGFRPAMQFDSALLDGVRELDDEIDFERFLIDLVPDPKKRLALRLAMEDVPYKSGKAHSIAKAVGVDESTVRDWIAQVREELKKRKESKS